MPSTISILAQLKNKYSKFQFVPSDDFIWSAIDNTVFYNPKDKNKTIFLLHELSHALLGHSNYDQDIQLIAMERQAWDHTLKLAKENHITLADDFIQSNLDSYRDWLHARSTCPNCKATGIQINKKSYKCLACNNVWSVNEAKTCALRRYNKIG